MRLDAIIGPDATLDDRQAGIDVTGLTADSRAVRPGYLFAALKGVKTDGNAFVAGALVNGAVAILTDETTPIFAGQDVAVMRVANGRAALARAAARFYRVQPETVVAVTGTNGKTSVAAFTRQIWERHGLSAASVGTIGIVSPAGERKLHHTTPDPVELQAVMADLAHEGVSHAAIEASSHGLAQHRLDGLRIAAGAFTNISRDHLDYHASFEDYFAAKCRLFSEVLTPGSAAVINADFPEAAEVVAVAEARGLKVMTVGRQGNSIRLVRQDRLAHGQQLHLEIDGEAHQVELPLVGDFQAANALVAIGLTVACGMKAQDAVSALSTITGARGRLEMVASINGAQIFVDFAHTPDALENAIGALRPFTRGQLIVVFGAGGDRDPGKRPQMGAAVARLADVAVVTDDNPRSETPGAIRSQVLAGCPTGIDGGDRATAIRKAIAMLAPGDILMVAGKGHETGQEIAGRVVPFSDQEEIRKVALDYGQGEIINA